MKAGTGNIEAGTGRMEGMREQEGWRRKPHWRGKGDISENTWGDQGWRRKLKASQQEGMGGEREPEGDGAREEGTRGGEGVLEKVVWVAR